MLGVSHGFFCTSWFRSKLLMIVVHGVCGIENKALMVVIIRLRGGIWVVDGTVNGVEKSRRERWRGMMIGRMEMCE